MAGFRGAWPALITPAATDGGVSLTVLRELTAYLLAKGIGGFYLCGSTGEGLFMSLQERMQVAEAVLDVVNGRVPTIVHVGCVATRDALTLAKHAREVGAAGVASVLPVVTADLPTTYLHYQAIAGAAPDLPFFPYLFGARTDAVSLMRELLQRIPNLGGAKYTGPDMFELQHLVELGAERNSWTIFSGMSAQCVYATMAGSLANIGGMVNCMPGPFREIHRCAAAGDLGQAHDFQTRANRVGTVLFSFGLHRALREAMRLLGLDCGEPRLPSPPLRPERKEALHQQLADAGFWELAAL